MKKLLAFLLTLALALGALPLALAEAPQSAEDLTAANADKAGWFILMMTRKYFGEPTEVKEASGTTKIGVLIGDSGIGVQGADFDAVWQLPDIDPEAVYALFTDLTACWDYIAGDDYTLSFIYDASQRVAVIRDRTAAMTWQFAVQMQAR